ncbi:MAG: type VI secretion system lipoprotein TssJ [Orrella sp.]|uniref:type VI secretion system lipoprotein TssJ n=1 Tax=Orrella sp. TaxID=1921583 RepID=UPI003BED6913
MRLISRLLVAFAMAISIGGCSSLGGKSTEEKTDQAKAKVSWSFEKEGIWLELAAQTDLNFYANRSHSLVLGVWQVDDEKVFVKLMGDPNAISHALATGTLPKAVLQLDRYVIQPDTRTLLKIDRVQDAKYVGIVAGYYVFDPARSARYYRIPLNIQSTGLISKDYTAEPAILALQMVLGSQRIINAKSLTYDADKKVVLETVPLSNEKLEVELSPEVLNQVAQESSAVIKLGQ